MVTVYLVDVDVLLHATITTAEHHQPARSWLDERLTGRTNTMGLAWPVLFAFIEATTGPDLLAPPATTGQAWAKVQRWLDATTAWTPGPGAQHARLVTELLSQTATSGRSVWAAHLAALAIEHGLTVASTNPVYRRLAGVRWFDPLDLSRSRHEPTTERTPEPTLIGSVWQADQAASIAG